MIVFAPRVVQERIRDRSLRVTVHREKQVRAVWRRFGKARFAEPGLQLRSRLTLTQRHDRIGKSRYTRAPTSCCASEPLATAGKPAQRCHRLQRMWVALKRTGKCHHSVVAGA